MNRSIRFLCMAVLMLFLFTVAYAQRFVNVSLDGAQTVCAITQDAKGVMWLGTDNGLYSYDGYHGYKHYAAHTISNTRVNALGFENKNLYMATGNGVLNFNIESNLYVESPGSRDFKDSNKRKRLRELRVLDFKDKQDVYGTDVYALLRTPMGKLMGKINGLYLNDRLVPIAEGKQPLVNALAYDAKRRCYWIGTEGALFCADVALRNFTKIPALNGNSVKCLAEEENGMLYVGTDNGLFCLSMTHVVTQYVHDSRDASTIPNNIVWACYVDKWQNVWIGTDNGLSRLSTHSYFSYTSLDKVTLSGDGNNLHAVFQSSNGDWWLGGTNGLIRKGATWYKPSNKDYPLTHNRVRKIYQDKDGDIWVCTDHGINLYNPQSQQMMNFIVYDKSGKYSTTWAYDILQDKKGRMWMASYQGGIFVMDKAKLVAAIAAQARPTAWQPATCVADYHFSDKGKNALAGLHVGQMVMDGKGMIWASSFKLLDCINPNTMRVTHIFEKEENINYLMASNNGNVWIGTDTGVRCYMVSIPMTGKKIAMKEWSIGEKVSTMCDVEGKIWVVTGNECCVLDPEGNSMRFVIPMRNPQNIFYSRLEHVVVLGGNDGYVTMRADLEKWKTGKRGLFLAGIVVNGRQTQEALLDDGILGTPGISPVGLKKLELKYDENNFTLQLSDLPFANHPTCVYAYRLEGSDHEWHYLNKGSLDITYNGLSYGDYQLSVHAVDGEGKIGDEVYSLEISVLPPWYLSIWCKIFYLTLLVVFTAWVVNSHFVSKQLKETERQKEEILEQVKARMAFYASLAEQLKAAVAHRSFEEVSQLVSSSLEVDENAKPELPKPVPEKETNSQTVIELDELDKRLLAQIESVIEENMVDSEFNVTMLQKKMDMGNKQLYRKVKALTGQTPVEYIRDMRMRKAAQLLKAGKFSVSEVMYTVGFSNSSYFSKCFSKAFGMTPKEYMKS